jgi:integrase
MAKRRGHNEGAIYQRKDGRWAGSVNLGWEDGKRKRKTVYALTRAEVAARVNALLADKNLGKPITSDRRTLASLLSEWLEDSIKPNVRPKTYWSFEQVVRTHLNPGLGSHKLAKLTPQIVQRFVNSKSASGLSPRTVQYMLAVLRRALRSAAKAGEVHQNVALLVDTPTVPQPEIEPYDEREARTLLAAVKGDRLEAIYTIAIGLGLRRGEALGLRWIDVDIDRGSLSVRQQLQRVGGELVFSVPKTAKSTRTLPLPAVLAESLSAHRAKQNQERLLAGPRWHDSGLVFTTKKGTPIEPRNLDRHFHAMREHAGLRHQRFHDLRHAAGSILIAQGVHSRVVQDILGHSTAAMTNRYTHVVEQSVQDAARRMNVALGGA